MVFELFCAVLIALLFGLAVAFGGYRFFLLLLPIWGFFFGLFLGANAIQALLGIGMFATITSWVVGFVVGAIFAVLSYLFYAVAVAVIAGSLGYGLGVGIMGLFGLNSLELITFIVGIVLAVALIAVTFYFNLAKYVIIFATGIGGAALVVGTLVIGVGEATLLRLVEDPVRVAFQISPLGTILFIGLAIAGIVVQIRANRAYEIETYNRWAEYDTASSSSM